MILSTCLERVASDLDTVLNCTFNFFIYTYLLNWLIFFTTTILHSKSYFIECQPNLQLKYNSNIPYHEALNSSQMEAVNFTEGPLLVIAGAGSGKTRTLTYRVARLVEKGVAPDSILLLTFTRKASFEMLKRAALLLDN
ncbi:MAG: UvrD-helicase domain-containing protein [Candidatus Desulfatibia sp.]|uniref:UvrD-helicase domain-containing protein n=1 Tax=Candidatus Desulfatibia sp. TaxID=3101189 RepID=UPI002F334A33